jgi:TetR/AcrR family transcriptional repressor of lmrAB and yxaGH operons
MTSTRDELIQKMCELLELQGYYGTGLNQIIRESGAPRGSLYYHFPGGKEELAAHALEKMGEVVLERIRKSLAAIDDPVEAVRRFILEVAVNVERSGFSMGGPITTVAMETAASSENLRQICDGIYARWREAFAEKLIASGVASATANSLASVIIASIEGSVILCRTGQTCEPMQHAAQQIAYLVERATR